MLDTLQKADCIIWFASVQFIDEKYQLISLFFDESGDKITNPTFYIFCIFNFRKHVFAFCVFKFFEHGSQVFTSKSIKNRSSCYSHMRWVAVQIRALPILTGSINQ